MLNPVATAGVKWRTRDIAPQIAYFNSLLSHPAIFDHLLSRTDSNNVLAKVCNGLVKSSLMDSPCSIFAVLCLCQSLSTTFADSKYGESWSICDHFVLKLKNIYTYLPRCCDAKDGLLGGHMVHGRYSLWKNTKVK